MSNAEQSPVASLAPVCTDYAAVTTYLDDFGYEGRRVRFSGMLKTSGVDTYAGVFLRAAGRHVAL